MYYYGARYYDPQISIFLSVDAKAEKFIGISPYAYVGNNPIKRIDPDGKDWIVVVNHDTRTITVQANFNTQAGNVNSIQDAANNWNAQSGKYSYVVGKGDNAKSYSINFDVRVNDPSHAGQGQNTVQVLPDNHALFQERREVGANGEEIIIKPQGVSNGTTFAMKQSEQNDTRDIAHEQGHNLGLTHKGVGIMQKSGGRKLTKRNVRENLGLSGIMGRLRNSGTDATFTPTPATGNAPDNFNSGKIKRNRAWTKTIFD